MSTVLNSMYMDIGERQYDMNSEQKSKYGRQSKSPVWWIAVAAACLGLILLFVIFGFVAHNASAIRKQDVRVGLMNFEKLINNLTQEKYAQREDLNQVKMNSNQLIKEMEMLRGQYNAVSASQDQLQQEVQKINCSIADASAIRKQDIRVGLMNFEKLINNLTQEKYALREELNQVKMNSNQLIKEMEMLRGQYSAVSASQDQLQQEVQKITYSIADASAIKKQGICVGLTNFEKLTQEKDALREELNQVKMNSNQLIKEMEVLRGQYNAVSASRDQLQQKVQKIKCSIAGKVCQQGWITFNNKCYYVSKASETKNWEKSRLDCQQKGANLVIITSKDEHDFVSKFHQNIWIGLSDKQQEGKWKWVDGSDLVQGFWKSGEPNNAGNEDCAEISAGKWNDIPCSNELPWICGQ
ncbi:uncharacterized protein KZ484_025221 [Pholidichthys leucotaenia]